MSDKCPKCGIVDGHSIECPEAFKNEMQIQFAYFRNDAGLSICSGLTAVLSSFTCSDAEKENALEYVLKQHRGRSLEKAREKAGV